MSGVVVVGGGGGSGEELGVIEVSSKKIERECLC
jgi:hypothetical protein